MNSIDRANLATFQYFVDEFINLGGDHPMHIQALAVFLTIARNPSILQCDLEARLPIASSSVSRNVAGLSARGRTGKPGLGLVRKELSNRNPRSHEVYLTEKGQALIERLFRSPGEQLGTIASSGPPPILNVVPNPN